MDNLKFHLGRRARVEFENTEIRKKHIPGRVDIHQGVQFFLELKDENITTQKYSNNEIWTKIARSIDFQCYPFRFNKILKFFEAETEEITFREIKSVIMYIIFTYLYTYFICDRLYLYILLFSH